MPDVRGRDVLLRVGLADGPPETFALVGRGTSHTHGLTNTAEEVNTKDEQGHTTRFAPGSRQDKQLTMTGVFSDDDAGQQRIRSVAEDIENTVACNFQAVFGPDERWAGEFLITEWSVTGETEGPATFTLTIVQTGPVVTEPDT